MNTVSASNSYSTSAATSKGMSGLVSNMDTESMVESLLSGTQKKIDKQNANKQVTTWKQEFYREIISNINTFQNSYFNSTSSTSLLSPSFFNAMSAVSKSEALSVTATSKAAAGKTEISVGQLATASKIQSGGTVSGSLTVTIDTSALDRKVVFNAGGKDYSITLQKPNPKNTPDTLQNLADQIKNNAEMISAGITASVKDGKLVIEGTDVRISSKSTDLGMKMLGVSAGSKTVDGKLTTTADPDAEANISVSLDGVAHTITLDGMKDATDMTDMIAYLQNKLDFEFGKDTIKVEMKNGKIEMNTGKVQGREIVLSGDKTTFKLFGIEDGQSNKIALGQQLQDVGFSNSLQGSTFKFNINGVDFEFENTATVSDVINKINSSKANVRVTYSELEDKFTIESAYTGAGYKITMEQTEGNLLNAMFGNCDANTGSTVSSNALTTKTVEKNLNDSVWNSVNSISNFSYGTFKLNVNGKDYSISVPKRTEEDGGDYSRSDVMELINQGLADRFGNTIIEGKEKQNIELTSDSGTYKIEVRDGSNVSFAKTDNIYTKDNVDGAKAAEVAKTNLQLAFGFEDTSNVAKSDQVTLADIGITQLDFDNGSSFSSDKTISDVLSDLNSKGITASFDTETGKISLAGAGTLKVSGTTSDGSDLSEKLFGTDTLMFGATQGNAAIETDGQNALVTINGVDTERSTNTFTANGLTVTLLEETNGETVTIDTTRNTNKIYEGIKSFVDDYNKLIGDLNGKIDEEASFRKYPPLTSEQKKEMSDKEVELWEEKAKTGLLRNDMNISSFLSSMRSALYTKPADCDFALYQLGIETSSEWEDKGKLVIDESKLKSMIETNAKDIEALFTDPTEGLAVKLQDSIKAAANTNSSSPGSLVSLAGVVGKATEITNTLSKQLRSMNSKIADLQDKYEKERARYWKMFNTMESTLSNLNTQSSWLYQQFS